MVDRIVAAGCEVLLERGYERTSTSRIAAQAGISPGSLYQYFPNKEAVLALVLDEYSKRLHARVTDAFVANLGATDPEDAVRRVVLALLHALESDAGLLRVLYEQLPRSADTHRAEFTRQLDQLVTTALLFQLGPRVQPVDSIAWILVRSIEAIVVSYVLDPPRIGRDAIVDELTRLVTGYVSQWAAQSPQGDADRRDLG
ncbi:TetR/AcrR family transcriptional regulator [Streptomyces sp. NPDC003011]